MSSERVFLDSMLKRVHIALWSFITIVSFSASVSAIMNTELKEYSSQKRNQTYTS